MCTYEIGTGNHHITFPSPSFIHGFPYYLQQEGYYVTNNVKTDYNVCNLEVFTKEAWNKSSNKTGWWNRKPRQPFFAVVNFEDSHGSRTMTNPYEWYLKNVLEKLSVLDRIGETEIDMPPIYRDSPEMLDRFEKDNLRDNTIIFFFADHGKGVSRGKINGINYCYRVPVCPALHKDAIYKNLCSITVD